MDFVVCTFSSNVGRLVYQLKAAQNLSHIEDQVISLDERWYFYEWVSVSHKKWLKMMYSCQ